MVVACDRPVAPESVGRAGDEVNCAGCGREMKDGDPCIKGTPSRVLGLPEDSFLDKLTASVLGGDRTLETDVLVYCLDCTEHGGSFEIEVYRAEEGGRR